MKKDLDLIKPAIMRGMKRYWEQVGKNCVIIGGTVEGSGLAEYLVAKCRNVTLVDTGAIWSDTPFGGSPGLRLVNTMPWAIIEEITERGVIVFTKEGKSETIEAHTIITATEPKLNIHLFETVKKIIPETYLLGMDYKENSIMDTIGSGYWVARGI